MGKYIWWSRQRAQDKASHGIQDHRIPCHIQPNLVPQVAVHSSALNPQRLPRMRPSFSVRVSGMCQSTPCSQHEPTPASSMVKPDSASAVLYHIEQCSSGTLHKKVCFHWAPGSRQVLWQLRHLTFLLPQMLTGKSTY